MKKCAVYKYCGGCKYQGIDYNKQLTNKYNYINNLLNKFCHVNDIIGMQDPYNYRNKVQVSFAYDEHREVVYGNYEVSKHTIVPFDDCMICDEQALKIIKSITKLVNKYKISLFDEVTLKGCLRHVLVRTTNLNQYMVVLVTGTSNINKKDLFINDVLKYNSEITTIVQNINNKHTSMVLGNSYKVLYGKGYVTDELCGLKFSISANSFYQVNKRQTEVLYSKVLEIADLNSNDIVLDAYCGTGTIGLVCSKHCKQVYGVEINKNAVKDAIMNAKNNGIRNCYFINADASMFMQELAKNKDHIDLLIMDPPRTGSDLKFLKSVVKASINRIVYVSCGPESLARDLEYLSKYYKVNSITPIDMFPFTEHVETIVSLSK